jgi:hypothetical protein
MKRIVIRSHLASLMIASALAIGPEATTAATSPAPTLLSGRPITQINLTPPAHHHSAALGIAEVLRKNGHYSLAVVAERVKPITRGSNYALWLRRSRSSTRFLGFIASEPGHPHRLRAQVRLPNRLWRYHKLLITQQTRRHPDRPGTVILGGVVPRFCGCY